MYENAEGCQGPYGSNDVVQVATLGTKTGSAFYKVWSPNGTRGYKKNDSLRSIKGYLPSDLVIAYSKASNRASSGVMPEQVLNCTSEAIIRVMPLVDSRPNDLILDRASGSASLSKVLCHTSKAEDLRGKLSPAHKPSLTSLRQLMLRSTRLHDRLLLETTTSKLPSPCDENTSQHESVSDELGPRVCLNPIESFDLLTTLENQSRYVYQRPNRPMLLLRPRPAADSKIKYKLIRKTHCGLFVIEIFSLLFTFIMILSITTATIIWTCVL